MAPAVRGRRVLVTGAAGSIGRALARHAAALGAAELVLVDRRPARSPSGATVHVADLADRRATSALPVDSVDVILHAAALKHLVPLERDPWSALAVNTIATLDLLERFGVGRRTFVFVSTDKAADPTSILGASKLLAERAAVAAGAVAVRLANVVDSDGSLIPRVRRAIELHRPVSLRDPDATRYLMTMDETVACLFEAAVVTRGGETLVPHGLRRVTVADMVAWAAGGAAATIRRTRLGPGEKKHERLTGAGERVAPVTPRLDRVLVDGGVPSPDVHRLRRAVAARDGGAVAAILRKQIPEWSPSPSCAAALAAESDA